MFLIWILTYLSRKIYFCQSYRRMIYISSSTISYKWDNIVFSLFYLVSFPLCYVKFYPCRSVGQYIVPLHLWTFCSLFILLWVDACLNYLQFFNYFGKPHYEYLHTSLFVNICCPFFWGHLMELLAYVANVCLKVGETACGFRKVGRPFGILTSNMWVSVVLFPCWHLVTSVFLTLAILVLF